MLFSCGFNKIAVTSYRNNIPANTAVQPYTVDRRLVYSSCTADHLLSAGQQLLQVMHHNSVRTTGLLHRLDEDKSDEEIASELLYYSGKNNFLMAERKSRNDDDDEVIRELDVYVTDSTLDLFLLQFPLRPIYAEPPHIQAARFKPNHKRIEIEIPFTSSNAAMGGDHGLINQKFHSATVARGTCLAAAVIRDNAMHITSLQEAMQLRPSFKSMQTHAWENVESMSDDEREVSKETPVEQIQMKRRETDSNQSARTQSYAHLQAEEEKEQWHRLQVLPAGSQESEEIFEAMYYNEDDVDR